MPDHDTTPRRLLSEDDLALIDALQINPQASWARLATVLGVDAATVARRWQRLESAGEAWTTAALGLRQLHDMSLAFLEIDCGPGSAPGVVDWLVGQPHVITVQQITGDRSLWCAVLAPSVTALSGYTMAELPAVEGVRAVRTHLATRVFDASRQWRLHVLSRRDAAALGPEYGDPASTRPIDDTDRRLYTLLSVRGRAASAELGEQLGLHPRSVQRRITRLLGAGDLTFRCDLARGMAGWHAAGVLWLNVPDDQVEDAGRTFLTWPETRTCAAVAGAANLLLTVGLHSVGDLHELAGRLQRRLPHARILDRQIVLRQYKLYGRILDLDGRNVGSVPVDPWHLAR